MKTDGNIPYIENEALATYIVSEYLHPKDSLREAKDATISEKSFTLIITNLKTLIKKIFIRQTLLVNNAIINHRKECT